MILLDTHAWIRWLHPEANYPLPEKLSVWLDNMEERVAVSVISALEVSQLVKKNRLVLPLPLSEWFPEALQGSNIECLPVSPELLHQSTLLPDIHRDPVDRIIIATAQQHQAMLITADEKIKKYPDLKTVWD